MINVNKIKGRMAEMGYSQKELARLIRVHEQTVSGYFQKGVIPSDKLENLAQALDISDFNFFFKNELECSSNQH